MFLLSVAYFFSSSLTASSKASLYSASPSTSAQDFPMSLKYLFAILSLSRRKSNEINNTSSNSDCIITSAYSTEGGHSESHPKRPDIQSIAAKPAKNQSKFNVRSNLCLWMYCRICLIYFILQITKITPTWLFLTIGPVYNIAESLFKQ
jgi:hypothetical protein